MLEDIQASLWVCVRLSTVFCRARGVRNVSICRNITFSWATRDSLSYTSCISTILFSLELIRNSMRKKGWLIIIFFSFFSSQRNPYRQYVHTKVYHFSVQYENMRICIIIKSQRKSVEEGLPIYVYGTLPQALSSFIGMRMASVENMLRFCLFKICVWMGDVSSCVSPTSCSLSASSSSDA